MARRRCNSPRAAASSLRNSATSSSSQLWVAISSARHWPDGEPVAHEKWQEHLRPHRRDAFGASRSPRPWRPGGGGAARPPSPSIPRALALDRKKLAHFRPSAGPFLRHDLPFWMASLVGRLLVLLIPIVAVLYPLMRFLAALYGWLMRRKIARPYGEL